MVAMEQDERVKPPAMLGEFLMQEDNQLPWHQNLIAYITAVDEGKKFDINNQLSINSIAFSPDGKKLVFGGNGDTVRIVDIESGNQIDSYNLGAAINSVDWSSDGKYIAAGGYAKKFVFGGAENFSAMSTVVNTDHWVNKLTFCSSSAALAISTNKGNVEIKSLNGSENKKVVHGEWVAAAVVSPDGKFLATTANDRAVKIFTYPKLQELSPDSANDQLTFPSWIRLLKFCPNSSKLAMAGNPREITLISRSGNNRWGNKKVTNKGYETYALDFSPGGNFLISAGSDKKIKITNLANDSTIASFDCDDLIYSIVCHPQTGMVAYGGKKGKVIVRDLSTMVLCQLSSQKKKAIRSLRDYLWLKKQVSDLKSDTEIKVNDQQQQQVSSVINNGWNENDNDEK